MKTKKIAMGVAFVMLALTATACGKNNKNQFKPYDYSKIVTLGQYKDLSIDVEPADVTDEQIQEQRDAIIKEMTTQEHVTDRVVGEKDKIHLQFTGYLDGVAFENGSTGEAGTDYTIGGGYIDDLNRQLIGLECGKEYSLNCKFPDDYESSEELKGKDTVFVVKVDYIFGKDIVPEWNDELVKSYTKDEHKTVADFEKFLKEQLAKANEEAQESTYKAALIANIVENSKISELPKDRVDEIYDDYYAYYRNLYAQYAMIMSTTYEELLKKDGLTDETLKEECKKIAESQVESIVVLNAIAKAEGISVDDAEYESKGLEYAQDESLADIEALEKTYTKEYIYETILLEDVADFLYKNNTKNITEKKSSDK